MGRKKNGFRKFLSYFFLNPLYGAVHMTVWLNYCVSIQALVLRPVSLAIIL